MEKGKSFEITQLQVLEAYKRVKANKGAGGVDGVDFEEFDKNKENNLYKLWNRMASGSYLPKAVRGVEIPKRNGKKRLLGIPTIEDRVAQMVVRLEFEPRVERIFCEDSYGYRPNKSAGDAVRVTRKRCFDLPWVLEFDIVGLFDNIDHKLMMKAVKFHTDSKWVILYIERMLKAPMQMPDGSTKERNAGTPQGGVISPVLANLYMHYAFDAWMTRNIPSSPFARYADDGIVHCRTREEAELILNKLNNRMIECELKLHPDKTRIVYCKNDRHDRKRKQVLKEENESFDFLGFTFRRRFARNKFGEFFNTFTPAVSNDAAKRFRERITDTRKKYQIRTIEEIADKMNPVIRGWANYFKEFGLAETKEILDFVNHTLVRWLKKKYKRIKKSNYKAWRLLSNIARVRPELFYHWQMGVKPTIG